MKSFKAHSIEETLRLRDMSPEDHAKAKEKNKAAASSYWAARRERDKRPSMFDKQGYATKPIPSKNQVKEEDSPCNNSGAGNISGLTYGDPQGPGTAAVRKNYKKNYKLLLARLMKRRGGK